MKYKTIGSSVTYNRPKDVEEYLKNEKLFSRDKDNHKKGFLFETATYYGFNEIVKIVDIREGRPIEDPYTKIKELKAIWWLPQYAALLSLDASKVPVAGNVSPLIDHEGRLTGMIATLFPVSETNYLQYRGRAQF